jgi:hypothetical protein
VDCEFIEERGVSCGHKQVPHLLKWVSLASATRH